MPCRVLICDLLFAGSFAFSATLSAQTSSIEGNGLGADGRPLKDAEVRFEQKGGQISPIISRTDVSGHYTVALPRGMYKMTLLVAGKASASIAVKATGANSRIDFDLRPSAEKRIKHYVWVSGGTGSHLHRLLLSPGCGEYGDAKREKRCEDASHSTALRAKSPVACFVSRSLGGVPASSFNTAAAPSQTTLSPIRAKAQ